MKEARRGKEDGPPRLAPSQRRRQPRRLGISRARAHARRRLGGAGYTCVCGSGSRSKSLAATSGKEGGGNDDDGEGKRARGARPEKRGDGKVVGRTLFQSQQQNQQPGAAGNRESAGLIFRVVWCVGAEAEKGGGTNDCFFLRPRKTRRLTGRQRSAPRRKNEWFAATTEALVLARPSCSSPLLLGEQQRDHVAVAQALGQQQRTRGRGGGGGAGGQRRRRRGGGVVGRRVLRRREQGGAQGGAAKAKVLFLRFVVGRRGRRGGG